MELLGATTRLALASIIALFLVSACSSEFFSGVASSGDKIVPNYPPLPNLPFHRKLNLEGVVRVGHRGAAGYCPENTLSAFRKAVQMEAQMIEFDVRLSQDHRYVVMHDDRLDRTTNGQGLLAEHPYVGDVDQLDAGSWFSEAFAGERVPTMPQVLEWVKEQPVAALVHVKQPGMSKEISRTIQELNLRGKIAILSEDPNELDRFKASEPEVPTILSNTSGLSEEEILRRLREGKHQGALLSLKQLDRALAERLHAEGFIVGVYGVESVGDIRTALERGAGMVLSKYPDRIQSLLSRSR